eukprot:TRINITY_DN2993_c0_g1_i1.p1 TRINITY_DN2993_c0_g1~~TRINITY_DN2993_c0_g1_i1.p1  ORF type:complete len:575 (+),score=95.42 TRINITY_DN2993_c0_g1_i1:76-1800(+)
MNIRIDEGHHDKRSWEPWSQEEIKTFFDSIVKYGRNWALIAKEIGTKRQEQVRTYFYRLLKKVTKLLEPLHFTFDSRDRMDTLIALVCYWEAKRDLNIPEAPNPSATASLARAVRDRIVKQRKELELMRSRRLPAPDKITFQLVPTCNDMASELSQAGCNPRLQLTVKSSKRLSSIIQHLMSKWTRPGNEGKRIAIATGPIRLFPHLKMGHPGWGVEDEEVTALKLFHALGCPEICKVDYSWKGVAAHQQQQHLGSDLSAAELEQYYQLFNNTEGNVAIKNEGSNHSNENSYSPEGHYFTLEDFHHSDEDHFDDLNIKLSSNDAFGFESGESHSYSVEERQVILPEMSMNTLNNMLNTGGDHESKNNNTHQNSLNLSSVSINNASINNVSIQQERESANQRSMLNASFSILHDASSMGFDASNDMFGTGFKHATSSFSTTVNNMKVEKIQSDQSPPPLLGANNGTNGQGYPSPRPSPVTSTKRRLQPESLFKEDSLDVSEVPLRTSGGSRNLGQNTNKTSLGVRFNENGKRDLQSFIEETSFVPFRSQVFGSGNGNQDNNEGSAAKRRKLDSVP